jgi:hypothetical protein
MRMSNARLVLLLLLVFLTGQSCSPSDHAKIEVTVLGVSGDARTMGVATTLNGRASANDLPTLDQGLDHFTIQLAADTIGTIGIRAGTQGADGCTFQSGTVDVEVTGPGSYQAEVTLTDTQGCLLIVRKVGDGSGNAELSDGTVFRFAAPGPSQEQCPMESLVSTTQQKVYPVDTTLEVRAVIPQDATPGSYLSTMRGCSEGQRGCEIRIGPDTTIVELQIDRNEVCSPAQLCWKHPLPQGSTLQRIQGQSASDIWAVGDAMLLHWEGTYWSSPRHPHLGQRLRGLVTGPSNTMVAVGEAGTVLRLINNVWSCPETIGAMNLNDAWGVMPSDFWAVGSQGSLVHYADGAWQTAAIPAIGAVELWRIYGQSEREIWAVGEQGTVLHYNGSTWNKVLFPSTETLYGLWENEKQEVWVVGDHGISAKIVNEQVTLIPTGTTGRLRAVYANEEPTRWAVGDGGLMLRFDGSAWSQAESGTREDLTALFGQRSTDIWAVGANGTQLRYNGVFWALSSVARSSQFLHGLSGISASSPSLASSLFAVGDSGAVLRNTGTDWGPDKVLSGVFNRTLHAVSAVSSSEIWLIGDGGLAARWDGSQLQLPITGTSADLQAIWARPSAALIVGSGGVLARWNGTSVVSAALPAAMGRTLRAVFGVTPLGAWMGGDGGMLLYWNGTSASAAPSPISDTIYGIWGSAANNLWAVADRGRVLHFDGSAWSIDAQASALSTTALRAIAGSSDTQIYAVGDGGVMLRFDGTSWSALDTGTDRSLSALWIDAAGTVVVAGQMGSIFRYLPTKQ